MNAIVSTFRVDKGDAAAANFAQFASLSRPEPGCLRFGACRSNDDPRMFVLLERWADQAALDAHDVTDHFVKLGVNGIRPLAQSRLAHKCTPLSV